MNKGDKVFFLGKKLGEIKEGVFLGNTFRIKLKKGTTNAEAAFETKEEAVKALEQKLDERYAKKLAMESDRLLQRKINYIKYATEEK